MHPLKHDATTELLKAISVTFVTFGGYSVEEVSSRSWASATFQGARHELSLLLEGEGAEARAAVFLGNLEAAEFALRGHLLADIASPGFERLSSEGESPRLRIRLEALTVEDC